MPNKPTRSAPAVIHSNPFSSVLRCDADFGTFQKSYYVTYFGPRVGLVGVRQGRVLLVRQYRFLIDAETLEIPGGAVEADETLEQAVTRELLEETGLRCHDPQPLTVYYPGLDNVENRTSVYFSENISEERPFVSNEAEVLGLVWMPIEECVSAILGGTMMDALTIIGILAYKARLAL
jgi:ADP-ribose pyrophosphatase